MSIINQDKLINKIDTYTLDTLPRSIIINGKYGSGKHTICNYLGLKLELPVQDISDSISLELIEELNSKVRPSLYLINGDAIDERKESVLLKFLEEPLKNTYIIILTENKHHLLNTILNRCHVWDLAPYTNDNLITFCTELDEETKSLLLKIADTPGKVLTWCNQPIKEVYEFCNKILDKIATTNLANILSISNKIDLDGSDKGIYDSTLFFNMLLYCAKEHVCLNADPKYAAQYQLTNILINSLTNSRLNKLHLFEHYLCQLKDIK